VYTLVRRRKLPAKGGSQITNQRGASVTNASTPF
jgi:hypothetical protein